jgi:outer membrane lipoprotein carrier protein
MWQILVTLTALIRPAVAPASAPNADSVVASVQTYYTKTQTLQADFRQTYTNTVFGKSSNSDGKLYIQKPGKMRWDYKKPELKHFISDGTTLWVYEKTSQQAFKQDLKDQILPVAITFLYGQGDLAKDFVISLDPGKHGQKGDHVLKLVPRQPSAQYKHLWLVVDPADFHVKESIVVEASDNVNHFTFFNILSNAAAKYVKASLFTFKPPKGVKVVTPPKPQ